MIKLLSAPRQPFVGLAIAAAIGIVAADYFWPGRSLVLGLACVIAIWALLLWCWPNEVVTYAFIAFGFFLLHGVRVTDTPGLRLLRQVGNEPRVVTATGSVVTEPKSGQSHYTTFLFQLKALEIDETPLATNATLFVRWRGNPRFGDELKLFGVVQPIAGPRNPGEFDMRSYLARHDVHRSLVVRYREDGVVLDHSGGNPILRAAQKSRAWMQRTLCRDLESAPDVQNFLSGIVLGLRHQTPEDIEEPFQQTGTLHLFAVAGLHVGIVARLLWIVAVVAQLPRKWATALIIPLLLFYAATTGLHVSSVRAAIMSSILLGGFFFDRKVFALNSLAAAAFFLLCWDSNELFSTGFQLSFAVVGTIVIFSDWFSTLLRRLNAPDPFLPRVLLTQPRRVWLALTDSVAHGGAVSAAAWLGSLVLILWYFHLIAPISLLANLVVVPIAFFVLAIAMLSLISAPIWPWLSVVFNNANYFLARIVLAIVHFFAQLPAGHYYLAHPHWPERLILKIDILDCGAGAAAHLQSAGKSWLLDCGSERDYERILREYLHADGVNKIDGLILTHGDSLHIGGAESLLTDMPPAAMIDNAASDRSSVHRRLRSRLTQSKPSIRDVAMKDTIEISRNVSAIVVYPPRGFAASNADDQALAVQVVAPSARILFMSDGGEPTERALVASGRDLRSDIVVKGQNHGSASGSDFFLDAVQPKLIVATSRDFPNSEHVSEEWAGRLRARSVKLFRQDETGAVLLRFRPNDWEAESYLTGEILRSSTR